MNVFNEICGYQLLNSKEKQIQVQTFLPFFAEKKFFPKYKIQYFLLHTVDQ